MPGCAAGISRTNRREERMNQATMPTQTEQPTSNEIDALKLQRFRQNVKEHQNFSMGLFAGLLAALIGAMVWALITDLTHYQIGWMAVGIGFLVGYSVRRFGQGIDQIYGIMGAILALTGCLVGNLLSICMMVAEQQALSVMDVLTQLTPGIAVNMMVATFNPMDVLFYGIAIYEGYRFAFRRFTPQEVAGLVEQT
jgi:hypothetical protein